MLEAFIAADTAPNAKNRRKIAIAKMFSMIQTTNVMSKLKKTINRSFVTEEINKVRQSILNRIHYGLTFTIPKSSELIFLNDYCFISRFETGVFAESLIE